VRGEAEAYGVRDGRVLGDGDWVVSCEGAVVLAGFGEGAFGGEVGVDVVSAVREHGVVAAGGTEVLERCQGVRDGERVMGGGRQVRRVGGGVRGGGWRTCHTHV